MTEQDLQSEIMNAIMPYVAFAYVTSTGTFKGIRGGRPFKIGFPGLPDIIAMNHGGRLAGIEVKLPGKEPTEIQMEIIEMINRFGGTAGVAHSVDEAIEILNKPEGWS